MRHPGTGLALATALSAGSNTRRCRVHSETRAVGPSRTGLLLATLTHMSYLTELVVCALFCPYPLADQVATLWLYSALFISDSCPARKLYHACPVVFVFVKSFFDTLTHMSYLTQRVVLALQCTYPLADRVSTRLTLFRSSFPKLYGMTWFLRLSRKAHFFSTALDYSTVM